MSITVLNPGLLTTVQDQGRVGYQQFGVSVSGVMDPRSAALANILAGNDQGEAVLECTMMGPQLQFDKANVIAITGGDLGPTLDGKAVPNYQAVAVRAGQVLKFTAPKTGCRAFIAFAGGLDIPVTMGSRSTYMKAKIGGHQGRKLEKGDVIGINTFLGQTYTVTPEFDRMGCRLDGPAIAHKDGGDIISDGIAFGAIQVPSAGTPIIMLADRQTTGGYTKIANVITADFRILAQLKTGDKVQFVETPVEYAQSLLLAQRSALKALSKINN